MNITNRWLLPEGIEEILPPKAIQLEYLCREIIDLFTVWGYEFVIPPLIEYLESLLVGTGEDMELKTFKLIDQLSGRLMGLRADMTPQIARIDAHLLKLDVPVRLCYLGSTLHTRPNKSGETRSPLQLGAELYGHAGVTSDIEIIKLMLTTLKQVGVKQLCIDIGHVGIFRCLSESLFLSNEQRIAVFEILQRKAKDELKSLFTEWKISNMASKAMLDLIDMNGDRLVLKEAKKYLGKLSGSIITYIEEINTLIADIQNQSDIKINIDLAELRGYHYHTGIVYIAYTRGEGQGIAFGGRYDDIGNAFGRARSATGFSTDVKSLLKFKNSDQEFSRIFAPVSDDETLNKKIEQLRASGKIVVFQLKGQKAKAKDMNCDRQLVFEKGHWLVKKVD